MLALEHPNPLKSLKWKSLSFRRKLVFWVGEALEVELHEATVPTRDMMSRLRHALGCFRPVLWVLCTFLDYRLQLPGTLSVEARVHLCLFVSVLSRKHFVKSWDLSLDIWHSTRMWDETNTWFLMSGKFSYLILKGNYWGPANISLQLTS